MTSPNLKYFDQFAREFTLVAIERGVFQSGQPADVVGQFYADVARGLHEVEIEVGAEVMNIAAEFAITAIRTGLIYAGGESLEFVDRVAQHILDVTREFAGRSNAF